MHDLDMLVMPWTNRYDFLAYKPGAEEETELWISRGIDGFFSENPKEAYDLITRLGNTYPRYGVEGEIKAPPTPKEQV